MLLGTFQPSFEDYKDILQWMQAGVLYAGSDGSVENKVGAHAFCFTNGSSRAGIIGGAVPTPGNKEEITSLRSESAGALCITYFVCYTRSSTGETTRSNSVD